MNIGSRIKMIRGELSLGNFAKQLSDKNYTVYKSNIKKYEDGEVFPSTQFYKALILKLGININWLITGVGRMYESTHSTSDIVRLEKQLAEAKIFIKENKKHLKKINLN